MVVNHCTPEAEAQWPLLELWLGTLMRPVNFFSKRESRMSPLLALGVLLILQCVSARLIASYNLTGDLPSTAFDFVSIPFFVPSGTAEIHIEHASIDDPKHLNILDFGVMQPDQTFRGWGGGNKQRVVIGEFATTRSYLLGPLDTNANWSAVIGKAQIGHYPGAYRILIDLFDQPTLPPQTERSPYKECSPLETTARWYAGDFHSHSRESGDAYENATLDEMATFVETQSALDFLHISDHNTVSAASFINDAQTRHPHLLFIPGVEWTTYSGHAGLLGCHTPVDHRVGNPGVTLRGAMDAIHAQGGLFSINHEDMYEPGGVQGNSCIGCAWDYVSDFDQIDAMEVAIQRWNGVGWLFDPAALDKWDKLHAAGYTHIAPLGGSDDHHGGVNTASPLGQPATMVFANELSHTSIIDGVRRGRTSVMFRSRLKDPLIELTASCSEVVHVGSQCVTSGNVTLFVRVAFEYPSVEGPVQVRLLVNNAIVYRWAHVDHSQSFSVTVSAPIDASIDRWRAQVHDDSDSQLAAPRAMTNHLFVGRSALKARR